MIINENSARVFCAIFMYYVYVIRSESGRFYIGSTENIEKRIFQHNEKRVKKWTNRENGWRLVYSESHVDITDARIRERQIKAYKWWDAFKKLIRRS